MPEHVTTVMVNTSREFAFIARGTYGGAVHAHPIHKSTQPHKRRAETLRLIEGILMWARANGITIDADGTVRG